MECGRRGKLWNAKGAKEREKNTKGLKLSRKRLERMGGLEPRDECRGGSWTRPYISRYGNDLPETCEISKTSQVFPRCRLSCGWWVSKPVPLHTAAPAVNRRATHDTSRRGLLSLCLSRVHRAARIARAFTPGMFRRGINPRLRAGKPLRGYSTQPRLIRCLTENQNHRCMSGSLIISAGNILNNPHIGL